MEENCFLQIKRLINFQLRVFINLILCAYLLRMRIYLNLCVLEAFLESLSSEMSRHSWGIDTRVTDV